MALEEGRSRVLAARFRISSGASTRKARATALLATIVSALAGCGEFDDPTLGIAFDPEMAPPPPDRARTPENSTRNLPWGDLHVQTALSYDAFTMGARGLPGDAYV
jgi:hypothetical protein